ncbi:MAG: outer membrane lipoprotein-sorting protein [Saprospiraceae bacterium]|nr:outer membrane lipoprotein-sorting protein [Saprospiraceae bacterium]MBK8371726.1 outer membrane lipoprotein-sorting protein [Saprospiraceae bacterium]MBK8546991.1 outer membrane lipoprotein-sorting protein [Saprospiraceae bacterium]MBK8819475.1 outer membrane lipoprotein-sorting protein [Saprospiraceae bacterium]MBK8853424.1 outer membrane lipoprotein-sorting protein [Saprospiraceae bacterium]
MKLKNFVFLFVLFFVNTVAQSQTLDEILNKYFENIGGREAISKVSSTKMTGKVNAQGMEFPTVMLSKGVKNKISFSFQGMEFVQPCFDGETGWQTNFMNMKAEKMEKEDSELLKSQFEDFPDAFLKYKDKGYKAELLGSETAEGTDCFKVKLTKKPYILSGVEEENATIYYFDKENFVPILTKSIIPKGPAKGKYQETVMSDYQESGGIVFPFSITSKFDGQIAASISIEKIEINVPIDDAVFIFPGE